ncbi:MAG: hypothetical protein IT208_15525 [Chthonomonadales bacterium]|nr:hypothetical protein [Chthonomonadales bacterium]
MSPGARAELAALVVAAMAASAHAAPTAPATVRVSAGAERVGMGRTVALRARALLPGGRPAAGALLLPYVNGKRWGAHEWADARGGAVFHMPLPNPGIAEIRVEARLAVPAATERWIWGPRTADGQTVYLQGTFQLPPGVRTAELWMGVDDGADAWLNGRPLGAFGGWSRVAPRTGLASLLRAGENVLSVRAHNGKGPAGLLARLAWRARSASGAFGSGPRWRAFETEPVGWPARAIGGAPAAVLGRVDEGTWAGTIGRWPTLVGREGLIVGSVLPPGACVSKPVHVRVDRRKLATIPRDPGYLVGIQWEPWFTPLNANWSTAQAVPLVGRYWSWNPDVTRQHMLWLAESGIDFLVVDWTNHLWDKAHWTERPAATNEIILSTTLALETLAEMRDEGIRVPRMVIMIGLNNGPSTTVQAINEEIGWIYDNYARNPRFEGLLQEHQGKPLLLVFNGGGPAWLAAHAGPPVDDSRFAVRWISSQHQSSHDNEHGYWSWMDGSLRQPVTRVDGKPEAMTVSSAFFAGGGWLAPTAYGRRNGWTYVESFRDALRVRPRFIQLHQFQEYAGQPEGQGYGPNHDVYVDSYSVELSDDIEPVSLTSPAYRGSGGWGYLFLNLTRALVDLYRQKTPVTTVVAIGKPLGRSRVSGAAVDVEWTAVGAPARGFTVSVDGRAVARGVRGTRARVSLAGLRPGRHALRVTAEGTKARYLLSYTQDSLPEPRPAPAWAEVAFDLVRGR